MSRVVGKFGLRPTPHGVRWPLKFSSYVDATKLPPIPDGDFGHTDLLTQPIGIYCNDQLGCCVVSGAEHETRLWHAEGSGRDELVFDDDTTISNYTLLGNYDPEDPYSDQGCDMVNAAQIRMDKGILDSNGKAHRVGAALQLQPGNWEQLLYACYYFDGVGLGILVTAAMQQAFQNNEPWDVDCFNPNDVEGGHYVPAVARVGGDIVVITWGQPQRLTRALYTADQFNTTVFAYASPEKLRNGKDLNGLSWSDMRADINALATLAEAA